jgi:hypothetical protein
MDKTLAQETYERWLDATTPQGREQAAYEYNALVPYGSDLSATGSRSDGTRYLIRGLNRFEAATFASIDGQAARLSHPSCRTVAAHAHLVLGQAGV